MRDDQELAALARAVHQVDCALDKAQVLAAIKEATGLVNRQIGPLVGMPRSTVDRYLRLLALPEDLCQAIRAGELGYRHWDAVNVRGVTQEERLALMRKARDERLGQRTVRRLAKKLAAIDEPDERHRLIETRYDAETEALLRVIGRALDELAGRGVRLVDVRDGAPIFGREADK